MLFYTLCYTIKIRKMLKAIDRLVHTIKESGYTPDASQLALTNQLAQYLKIINAGKRKKHMLSWLGFKRKALLQNPKSGIYIWGDVGRGKSLLLDVFYKCLDTTQKKRAHFHEFMIDVHTSLDELRKNSNAKDHILQLAADLAEKYHVIILDELQINNIADAMIVGRLFSALIDDGVLVFFSSNRIPDDLFKDGLQRELFLPFIKLIKEKLEVFHLDHAVDYRMLSLNIGDTYFHPLTKQSEATLDSIVTQMIGDHKLAPVDIEIDSNRILRVFKAYGRIAVFSFRELCEVELGALDYIAICKAFKVVVIKNIPKLSPENHNELLRFITLIDCMYDNKTKLLCTADADIKDLYSDGKHNFEFQRTVSRLVEMRSHEYFEASNSTDAHHVSSMVG